MSRKISILLGPSVFLLLIYFLLSIVMVEGKVVEEDGNEAEALIESKIEKEREKEDQKEEE